MTRWWLALPNPGPCPPQPPPTSRYDSLVVRSPQPCPSLFTTTTNKSYSLVARSPQPWSLPAPTAANEFMTLVGGSSLAPAFLPCPIHQRVVKTHWWLFPVSPPPALPPPASRYDSLVVCSPQPPSSRPRLSLPLHNHHQRVVMTHRWFALSSPRPFSPGPPSSPTSYTPWWVSLPSSLSPALLVFW